jgi:ABC-type multidrug transport system fused ATPase/permease subunit
LTSILLLNIQIQEAKIAFQRMFEFSSLEREKGGEIKIDTLSSLKIQNLSFRFAGRRPLLKNINLEIRQNQCVAMVGESGSGKSTLGQILQRFYTFESGEIIVNNHVPLQDIQLSNWRTHIGVVPQEITIFNGTVLDNIVLGSDEDPEKVILFCQEYGFHPFITQLPQGYATLVGEEGINLSGGQKQLIALARALYRKPSFLMLDEPTAALDRNTEKFVLALLQQLKSKLSIFFISHRIHTLKDIADVIYVLENGFISAFGSHEKLLTTDNFYSHYWKEVEPAGR